MKMRTNLPKPIVFLICCFCWLSSPVSLFAQSSPYEQIYFCLDQAEYSFDDTIHVEGLVVQVGDSLYKAESQYAVLQVFDVQDSMRLNLKLRCDENGYFRTTIPCQALWKTGLFQIRAYTRVMCNYSPETFPRIGFSVSGKPIASQKQYHWTCSDTLNAGTERPAMLQSDTLFQPEKALEIRGKAVYWRGRHPVKRGHVIAYQRSTMKVYETTTDEKGRFCFEVDDYESGEEFYLQASDKKEKVYRCDFTIDNDYVPALPLSQSLQEKYKDTPVTETKETWQWERMLPEVVVRAKRKYDRKESKRFYKNLVLTAEDLDDRFYLDLDQAISYFSPYMFVKYYDGASKGLYSRRQSLLTGSTPVKIVVDGVEMSYDECNSIVNISGCESIEYVHPGETLGVPGVRFALGGALVITTKKGNSFHRVVNSNGQSFFMQGIDNLDKGTDNSDKE